jgi:hypothetical protein
MAAWLRAGASVVALVVAVLSARVVIRRPVELDLQLGLVFLFWSVAPAVWFLFEYSWIWRRTGGDFEDLKYGQELAKAVWVGIATVLLTLILGHSGKATPPAESSAAAWRLTE